MQRLSKIVSWTSIVLLSIWILTPIFGTFIPLEFSNNHDEYIYDSIRFFGIPIAIFLILLGSIKKKDTSRIIATKALKAIGIMAFSFFIMMITFFAGMCDTTTHKVFFENKQCPSTKIVQRSFGCGATDSSPATMKVSQIREITPYLIWVTSVDTSQIDKSEWNRIE